MVKKLLFGYVGPLMLVAKVWAFSCGSPVVEMEKVADDLLGGLGAQCAVDKNQAAVEKTVRTYLIPHVDVLFMCQQILGRKYWEGATEEQRVEFQKYMLELIVQQYSYAFNCNRLHDKVTFHPLRGEVKKYVRVESTIVPVKGAHVGLKYAMRCLDGHWYIYDLIINGLSLGQTYRSQFGILLKKGGVEYLIAFLKKEIDVEV